MRRLCKCGHARRVHYNGPAMEREGQCKERLCGCKRFDAAHP